jgi:hypothetical protein
MIIGRAIGWICLVLGLMVLLRDLLVWFDTGRLIPMTLGESWALLDRSGRYDAASGWAANGLAIWTAALLLGLGLALLVVCRRRRVRRFG